MQPGMDALNGSQQAVDFLSMLQRLIGERDYTNWFRNCSVEFDGEVIVVGVSSPFMVTWMRNTFREAVETAARDLLGSSAKASFQVDPNLVDRELNASLKSAPATSHDVDGPGPQRESESRGATEIQPKSGKGRRFSDLSDFVPGDSNSLAYAAAIQSAEQPGLRANPVYIHGGVGLGKTHLLEGVYRMVRRNHPGMQVSYVTSEAFANYFTRALRERSTPAFRQKFRTVDVLIVDDTQFLDGKRMIQEEFLHTVKHLLSHGRQVVVAGDRHPRLLNKSSEELVSHLLSGLVCRIDSPDEQTRRAIVERKLERCEVRILSSARDYVAQRFRNIRELEGALHCLATYGRLVGRSVTESRAVEFLGNLERDCIRVIRISDVEQAVCRTFGVTVDDLKSSSRNRRVTQPRRIAIYLSRKLAQAAYSEIGRHFGGRNHSTILSAEKKVAAELQQRASVQIGARDWPLGELIDSLEGELNAVG